MVISGNIGSLWSPLGRKVRAGNGNRQKPSVGSRFAPESSLLDLALWHLPGTPDPSDRPSGSLGSTIGTLGSTLGQPRINPRDPSSTLQTPSQDPLQNPSGPPQDPPPSRTPQDPPDPPSQDPLQNPRDPLGHSDLSLDLSDHMSARNRRRRHRRRRLVIVVSQLRHRRRRRRRRRRRNPTLSPMDDSCTPAGTALRCRTVVAGDCCMVYPGRARMHAHCAGVHPPGTHPRYTTPPTTTRQHAPVDHRSNNRAAQLPSAGQSSTRLFAAWPL